MAIQEYDEAIRLERHHAEAFYGRGLAYEALGKTLEASGVPHEMLTYSGAVHAFTDFDNPDRYNARADERSWRRYTDFLSNAYK